MTQEKERDDTDHEHCILYKRTTRLNKKLEFKGSFYNLRHINKTITVPNILYIYCIKYSIMRTVCVYQKFINLCDIKNSLF